MTTAPVPTEKKIRDIEWMDKIRLNPDLVAKEARVLRQLNPLFNMEG